VPGLGEIPFVGYDGDTTWLGYALIEGRWSTAPGEAVAPTNFFTQSGLAVGDSATITREGRSLAVRLVGEIFDSARENRDNVLLRGSWTDLTTLQPGVQASRWEIAPKEGADPHGLRTSLQSTVGSGVAVYTEGDSKLDESFLLFLGVVGFFGAVLVAISLGGVFNTVLLQTRQRTREMAVLKAVGLTPAGVVGMVVASVVPVALLAGLIGVPVGMAAQRAALVYMGQVAEKTDIPPAVFDVFPIPLLIGLALAGLAIGAVGAYGPAQRAARMPIAPVLQAE
jgi:putative ABC transport system permease protein